MVNIKNETPSLGMFQTDPTVSEQKTAFGWLPAGKSAFIDERVRQAMSMSYDRELWVDTFYNISKFEQQGLPVDTRWNSHLPQIDGWWIDPRDTKNFGPNAKYFQHDVAEAKKLLSAAGYPNGLDIVSTYISGTQYGTNYQNMIQVLEGMAQEAGFRLKPNLIDYQSEFLPKYRDAKGQHEGLTYKQGPRPSEDPVARTEFDFYSKSGPNFLGFDSNGKGDGSGDPQVDSILTKARGETDDGKRKALLFELQAYLAKAMYCIRWPGGASGFTLAWPALGNFNVFRGDTRGNTPFWWVDASQPPLKS